MRIQLQIIPKTIQTFHWIYWFTICTELEFEMYIGLEICLTIIHLLIVEVFNVSRKILFGIFFLGHPVNRPYMLISHC